MDNPNANPSPDDTASVSSSVEQLLLHAMARNDDSLQTGRYVVTFKESAVDEGIRSLSSEGLRVADAREFTDQAVSFEDAGDAESLVFPEIGVAILGGDAALSRGFTAATDIGDDSPISVIEPEYFAFSQATTIEYLRGFTRAAELIAQDLSGITLPDTTGEEEAQVLGATWGLSVCKVLTSARSGAGIRVAVLDTGMDLGHSDFIGRAFTTNSFVGQAVQDMNGHGTHCIGTATGPRAPAGTTPRYGIAYRAPIFVGKVLTNSGSGTTGSVLAGMNWAIANNCQVISMSLGSQSPVQTAYTQAGAAALARGLLIIAAAGNNTGAPTGSPANSPTIMAVASLDSNLRPSSFSNAGKIDIAGPGRDVFSSWPRPRRYNTISGTSMATPHVAGCAALWAESNSTLRGMALWRRLQTSARSVSLPARLVGAGLVQAP